MTFNTLVNFRDLGDYKTSSGQRIISKKLLRSGELVELSKNDIQLLIDTYHLTQIVDFRSEKETKKSPDDKIEHATYTNIDLFKGDEKDAPALEQIEKKKTKFSADERMFYVYKHLITSPNAHRGFHKFIQILLDNKTGSTIWHCFAGKDRTGLASALVLYLLGASKETIYEDYLLTNKARKAKNEEIIASLKANGGTDKKINDTLIMLNVKREYLDYAVKIIIDEYHNLDHYIHDVLKISQADKAQLQTQYLHE